MTIKNLGLAGGGFFGIAQVAVLEELESKPGLLDLQDIRGSSVGAMIAALYSVGYTAAELRNILLETDFDPLIRDGYFWYFRVWCRYGMYDSKALEDFIENLIQKKTHIKMCTFAQIKIKLTVIATNLNYQRAAFFNRETSPDLAISKAVRMSIGYPPIMTPVLYQGDLYGDAGEFINYPITTFSESELSESLGITFAAHNENRDGTLKHRDEITDLLDYLKTIGVTMNRATYVSQLNSRYLERSIVVEIEHEINSMKSDLSHTEKETLYFYGKKAAAKNINVKDFLMD